MVRLVRSWEQDLSLNAQLGPLCTLVQCLPNIRACPPSAGKYYLNFYRPTLAAQVLINKDRKYIAYFQQCTKKQPCCFSSLKDLTRH